MTDPADPFDPTDPNHHTSPNDPITPETEDLPGPVRVRIAPSPTGHPHVGTAYQAVINLGYARSAGGRFVLRVEDTDRARYVPGSEEELGELVRDWLGLGWDEGPDLGGPAAPYRQSDRLDHYRPFVDKLIADGHAYHCWCSTERLHQMRAEQQRHKRPTGYDRLCLGKTREERAALAADGGPGFSDVPVVRMLVPDDPPLTFTDLIRGELSAPRPDDQVIMKADGFPTYHLAVVVDDHEMGITTVVRGEEWISSTPKQLLLYDWLGWDAPTWAHTPVLRNADKSKMSKRKNPWSQLSWFRDEGYLPEALVNFLCLMAYPPSTDAQGKDLEVFDFADFVGRFDWSKINAAGPFFDLAKLDWLNGVYIRRLDPDDLAGRLVPPLVSAGVLPAEPSVEQRERLRKITDLIQTRMAKLTEAPALCAPFYVADEELPFADDALAQLKPESGDVLRAGRAALAEVTDWVGADIEAALRGGLVDGLGLKPRLAFGPLRVAVSGQRISPPLFESMEILGREATLARIDRLLER